MAGGALTRTELRGRRRKGKRAGAVLVEDSGLRAVRRNDSVSAGFALDLGYAGPGEQRFCLAPNWSPHADACQLGLQSRTHRVQYK